MKRPGLKSMIHLFERSGLRLSETQYDLFWRFHSQIRKRNATLDLTRIRSFEGMVIKHYVDSALVARLIQIPSPLLDIGSGGGLPGIPIKILVPNTALILAEGRKKRASFLEETCTLLGFNGVRIYPHKITKRFEGAVSGVITRALETMDKSLDRISTFLPPQGKVIFMKGPNCREELEEAVRLFGRDFRLEKDISYRISSTPNERRLVVFTRRRRVAVSLGLAREKATGRKAEGTSKKDITSPENPTFKRIMNLGRTKGIRRHGLALLSGPKQVREVLRDFPDHCAGLVLCRGLQDSLEEAGGTEIPRYFLSPDLFRQADFFGTAAPILVVRVASFPHWDARQRASGCTLCVPFQDPANVGAVVRAAAAFGISRLLLMKEAAHPFHPKSMRVAGSTLFRVPMFKGPSLEGLKVGDAAVVTLSPEGADIHGYRFPKDFFLVPGLEGPGLPTSLRKATPLAIPMEAGVESINAALATGIALDLWRTQVKSETPDRE